MNARAGDTPLLIPMVCPQCGGDLEAGPGDRMGLCFPCQAAHFLGRAGGRFSLRYLRPVVEGSGRPRFLPFWKVHATWLIRADPGKNRLYARFPWKGELFFPAFWRPMFSYHSDLTLRLLTLQQQPLCVAGEDPMPGGVRSPEVIPPMARLLVLSYLDRIADVEGVDLEMSVQTLEYVGYPFWKDPEGWTDGICGLKFPPSLFSK